MSNQFWRKFGASAYGLGEGVLDTLTFGTTDALTDTLWDNSINKNKDAKVLNQFRGGGNMAGAIGTGIFTGNVSGAINEGLEGFADIAENSSNEKFQKASTYANLGAQLSGFASGANNLTNFGSQMAMFSQGSSQATSMMNSFMNTLPKQEPAPLSVNQSAMSNRQSMRFQLGGLVGDPPKKNPIYLADATLTPDEIKFLNSNDEYCPAGNCLETTRKAFDKTAGSIPGIPFTANVWESMGIQSLPTTESPTAKQIERFPYFKGDVEGASADSWDIHGNIVQSGGKNFWNSRTNTLKEFSSLQSSLPVGTLIGWGKQPFGGKHLDHSYNNEFNLPAANHSTMVVGYNESGVPIVYDGYLKRYGTVDEVGVALKNNLGYQPLVASAAKEYITSGSRENLKNTGGDYVPIEPYNVDLKKYSDFAKLTAKQKYNQELNPDLEKLKTFTTALNENKAALMSNLGIRDSKEFDKLANLAVALSTVETEGGNMSWGEETVDNMFGDTKGMTQLNMDNIFNDDRIKKAASARYSFNGQDFGLDGGTLRDMQLKNPEKSAVATLIYLSQLSKDAERYYSKGQTAGERVFTQPISLKSNLAERVRESGSRIRTTDFYLPEIDKRVNFMELDRMSLEDATKYLNNLTGTNNYRVSKNDDGAYQIAVKTKGNNPNLSFAEKMAYAWQSPNALLSGDAEGKSIYAQRVKDYFTLLNGEEPVTTENNLSYEELKKIKQEQAKRDAAASQLGLYSKPEQKTNTISLGNIQTNKKTTPAAFRFENGGLIGDPMLTKEPPKNKSTVVYNKNDERLTNYNWQSKIYNTAPTIEERLANPEKKWNSDTPGSFYLKYNTELENNSHYKELKVCEECGWDEYAVKMWKDSFPGIKGMYHDPSGLTYYVFDSPKEIVEYKEPPKIKGVWGEQIYKPNTNNKEYDYRYVVEQEDGSLLELANEEQYSKFKQTYGFENNLPVRYGRIPQFRNTPVLQTYKNGSFIEDPPKTSLSAYNPLFMPPKPKLWNEPAPISSEQKMRQNISNEVNRRAVTTENTRTTPKFISKEERDAAIPQESLPLKAADIATDIMQLGNFIPLPQTQAIGKIGNVLGATIDGIQIGEELYKGANADYGNIAVNTLGIALPKYFNNAGYTRDMYNTIPGSMADKIANYGNRAGSYRHLTAYPHLRNNPVIRQGISANRKALGLLGTETAIDSYAKGGLIKYSNGSFIKNHEDYLMQMLLGGFVNNY